MNKKLAYWIGGIATGFLGVALVRLVAPEMAGTAGMVVAGTGYTLVVVGITVISFATRRKPEDAYITVERTAKSRKT